MDKGLDIYPTRIFSTEVSPDLLDLENASFCTVFQIMIQKMVSENFS